MKDKEYRELQLSSSLLIFIFLVIIVLGVVIFILGVSVGKKQAVIANQSTVSEPVEKIEVEKPPPVEESEDPISQELASHQQTTEEKKPPPPPSSPPPIQPKKDMYYIQLGAFQDKNSADALAKKYQEQGYNCTVFDPLPADKRRIYRVRIGGYETREQAQQEKARLIRAENKKPGDYFIVKH